MRLRFGTFIAPFHSPDHNPTLSLESDLELLQHMDKLGFDEAWIGEHHSAGSEIIASPEIFLMAAAERTSNIKLGTGVVSLPYHNPLWVAERIVLLDHLTKGRIMLGVGPGALPTDAAMLGLEPTEMRPLLDEYMKIVMHLLTSDEPISYESDRLTLKDARLHLRPYSDPLFDVAVAAVASPSGAKLAGQYGAGMLSLGATVAIGMDVLAHHWTIQEEVAAKHGQVADRDKWRLVGTMHLAETEQQARSDVEYGIAQWFKYFQNVAAFPQMAVEGGDIESGRCLRIGQIALHRRRQPLVEAHQQRSIAFRRKPPCTLSCEHRLATAGGPNDLHLPQRLPAVEDARLRTAGIDERCPVVLDASPDQAVQRDRRP
jgi:limonene 1,2-monooxygenase